MIRRCLPVLLALLAAAPGRADDAPPPNELDGIDNIRLLDTHFARYGFEPLKRIYRQDEWCRIRLPASTKERQVGQTGLYSYVTLAGDFELEATFGFAQVPDQKGGYGMSAGIAVDTNGPEGFVALARTYSKQKGGSGYAIVTGKPDGKEMKYTSEVYPTGAKTGRLSIRREKAELICLAREAKSDWQELARVPYTAGSVRQIRLYADTGGSASELDVWIGALRVRADEITGGFPKRERRIELGWWHAMLALCLATAGLWLWSRRQQRRWPWSDPDAKQPRRLRRVAKSR